MTTTWHDLAALVDRHGGRPCARHGNTRHWRVPHPSGGWLTLEITLRPRWCSIAVDRWHTADRDRAVAEPWFREHVWPLVDSACRARRACGYGVLPTGGATFTSAHPIDRDKAPTLIEAWLTAELSWARTAPAEHT